MRNVLAGHTNSYHSYTLDQALAGIAAAGFQSVELSAVPGWTEHLSVDVSDADIAGVRAHLARYGLTACALSGHGGPPQALTTDEGVEHALKALRLAHRLGIPVLVTAIGGHDPNVREDEAAFLQRIGTVADEAERLGVIVALEVHGELMRSAKEAVALIERIGRSSVGIAYDTANVTYYSGLRADEDIEAALPCLVHVHVKDTAGGKGEWNFPAVGSGHVRWARVLEILERGGYQGALSVEIEFRGEPWPPIKDIDTAMAQSHRALQATLDTLSDSAQQ